jgi:EmrB/QacA subfamily drug resistance transporter
MVEENATGALSRLQLRTVLVVLLSGQLLSALDQTIVGTALPTMVGQLGRLDDFSLVVTAYLLTSTISTALYGKLADLYGPKPVYLAAIGIFTVGSALVGLSQDLTEMVIFRAVQGIGAGGLVILAFTISSSVVPPRQIGRIQGLVGAMYALASLIGPLLAGVFTEYASWRWCFLINVPVGVLALLGVATMLRLPAEPRAHRVDYSGALLLTGSVAALVLVTVLGGGRFTWRSPVVSALAVATVLLAVLFVLRERRAAEPLVPLRLFASREVSLAMAITFLIGVAIIGGYFFLPIYLQVVRAEQPTAAGLQLLPLMIAVMVGSGLSGWLISALLGRMKAVVIAGTAVMTVSQYLLSRLGAASPTWQLWTYEAVLGLGMGMVISKLIVAVQNSVERRDLGVITAQAAFFRTIGSAIGTAVFGVLLTARLGGLAGLPGGTRVLYADPKTINDLAGTDPVLHERVVGAFAGALHLVFLAAVPIMVLALALTLFLPNTRLRADQSPWGEQPETDPAEPVPSTAGTPRP